MIVIPAAAAVRHDKAGSCELQRYLKWGAFIWAEEYAPDCPGPPTPPDLTSNYLLILR